MKKLLIVILIVIFPVLGWSAPFLVCDPATDIFGYDVEVNGSIVATGITPEADGSAKYDLAGQAPGPYNFRLRAIGQGGYPSEWSSPLPATKPGAPGNVRIQ